MHKKYLKILYEYFSLFSAKELGDVNLFILLTPVPEVKKKTNQKSYFI